MSDKLHTSSDSLAVFESVVAEIHALCLFCPSKAEVEILASKICKVCSIDRTSIFVDSFLDSAICS